ncbi:enoyl-CoA hydratase/isomerase family protein [Pseudofrankia inefficax]|uniref:Enoyl-CoA hydratase/isomerase n=1 Tax=Pseudofrankia inefficax (strain DSM 45817 / CECT 9037 / DDB 130130 / EuI1c) TaxID=298654 RepID=E3IU57_PSEI1|nr:enoyl-CoA hydratase/isomerase family protein [Pseudofrankia inefficax]ADP81250.1 Enoyl-CoA hydratase/isomerase [Pseudofrankia inefficax]
MTVLVSRPAEHVAVVTLNRPDSLNSVTHELLTDLGRAFAGLDADRDVRAIVLAGAGRGFCAGLDLRAPGRPPNSDDLGEVPYKFRFQRAFSALVESMHALRPALVAAVHGPAVGAGLALALACDTRVAGPGARFGVGPVRIGLSGADVGISYHLPRAVGTTLAFEMMLTGRIIDAREADARGLVLRVVDDPLAGAVEVAAAIAANAPFALWTTRDVMLANVDAPSLRHAVVQEDRAQVLVSLTADSREGRQAFAERRTAKYQDG